MKIALFGASGMIGQGVLRECLLDADVEEVLRVVRRPLGRGEAKLRDIVVADLDEVTAYEQEFKGFHACFFCLGVSASGMSEENYRKITYDLTIAVAESWSRLNPQTVFIYVSGAGTDSTERGRWMWARVKGATENALLRMPLKAYMFRIGAVQPLYGIESGTRLYRLVYSLGGPLVTLLRKAFPKLITTTEIVGRGMLRVAKHGAPKRVLENADINQL